MESPQLLAERRELLQVGHLVFGQVVKAQPSYDAVLVCLTTGHLAVLPHAHRDRPLKVGDTLAATVWRINATTGSILLSQQSVHYFRKIAELVLAPVVAAQQVRIRRVASAAGAPFVKILVEELGPEGFRACLLRLPEFKPYLARSVVLIPYDPDPVRLIKAALRPAPPARIRRIALLETTRTAQVEVEPGALGAFLGYRGLNVAVANKLVGYHLELTTASDRPLAASTDPL
jgi:transcription antitermination factor NusA-like protein